MRTTKLNQANFTLEFNNKGVTIKAYLSVDKALWKIMQACGEEYLDKRDIQTFEAKNKNKYILCEKVCNYRDIESIAVIQEGMMDHLRTFRNKFIYNHKASISMALLDQYLEKKGL